METKDIGQESPESPLNEINVLVVDDDKFIPRVIKNYLMEENYTIEFASSGEEALVKINEKEYDLVILDIMMPGMSGYDVCKKLRRKHTLNELPIIMLTSKDTIEDIVKAFDLGANDYISKPFDRNELLARVKTLIRLKLLTKTNSILKEAIDTKNHFMQMTIHDLKNPLNVITGFTQLIISESEKKSEINDYAEMIKQSSELMMSLVQELLEMAKFESGLTYLKPEKMDLNEVVADIIEANLKNAEKKKQKIHFSRGPEKKSFVNADPVRIHEIVDNLLSNAVKYSPLEKSIWVSVSKLEVEETPKLRIEVKDEGPGLTKDDLNKLFGKFQRLSARPTGGESSTGLGLSIVKKLVDLHKGKIWAESEKDKGAAFIVEFDEFNPLLY